jgi:hypothetical protein
MDDLHTDGNEAAGMLDEFAAAEITTTMRRCQHCHSEHALGEHRAYHGAGMVLGGGGCGSIGVRVAAAGDDIMVEWRGTYRAARVAD